MNPCGKLMKNNESSRPCGGIPSTPTTRGTHPWTHVKKTLGKVPLVGVKGSFDKLRMTPFFLIFFGA